MSFDLLDVPAGYETDLALVIAPYFDPAFAKRLVKEMSPNRVRFVVDDGARAEDIDALVKACGKADVMVAVAAAPGIAHLKGFYFEFVRAEGKRVRKRRFLFGSANATNAAFSGKINAELIAEVDLTAGGDADLLEYLKAVVDAVEGRGEEWIGDASFGPLQNAPVLHMPAFHVKPLTEGATFDSWLQRGVLAAKYRDAQHFLNITIRLSNALPKDAVAEIFADQGLIELGAKNVVRFPYVGQPPVEEGDDGVAARWRAQYCVWSHLGDWVADGCYRALGNSMQAKSSAARDAKVKELRTHADDTAWKAERRQMFLGALDRAWKRLAAAGINPADYLAADSNGINAVAYGKRFDDKLEADLVLADDKEFRARYVNGYDFPDLPRFRQDTAAWESFVRSWGDSVAVEALKPNTLSKAAKAIGSAFEAMEIELAEQETAEIIAKLRKSWGKVITVDGEKTTVGEYVSAYHER